MWSFAVLAACLVASVAAHGRVFEPPSRSSAWRFGFPTPADYDDDGANCGGFAMQHSSNGGKCGICGDPYNISPPRPHELGGTYGVGLIVANYPSGSLMTTTVDLTTSHRGFWEFKLCPDPESNDQACFDQHVLATEDGETKYYPNQGSTKYNVTYKLPSGLVCEHCVLQWRYTAGNNWGICANGSSGLGCGPQEQFGACSDISIGATKTSVRDGPQNNDIPAPLLYYLKNGYFDAQQGVLHLLRGTARPNGVGSTHNTQQPQRSNQPSQPRGQHPQSAQHKPNQTQRPAQQRPTQQNQRPTQQNLNPNQQNQRPTQQNQRPTPQNQRPTQQNQRPTQQNQRPIQQNQRLTPQNLNPNQQNQRPTQQNQKLTQQNQISNQQNQKPTQQNQRPSQRPVQSKQKVHPNQIDVQTHQKLQIPQKGAPSQPGKQNQEQYQKWIQQPKENEGQNQATSYQYQQQSFQAHQQNRQQNSHDHLIQGQTHKPPSQLEVLVQKHRDQQNQKQLGRPQIKVHSSSSANGHPTQTIQITTHTVHSYTVPVKPIAGPYGNVKQWKTGKAARRKKLNKKKRPGKGKSRKRKKVPYEEYNRLIKVGTW